MFAARSLLVRRGPLMVQARGYQNVAKVLFTARAQSDSGNREGNVRTHGEHHGNLNLKLDKHPNLGGKKKGGTNPEELFACGYAACFNGALRHMAKTHGYAIGESFVDAAVTLGVVTEEAPRRLSLEVTLTADVRGATDDAAQALAELAHDFCPYSRALEGNVKVNVIGVGEYEKAPQQSDTRVRPPTTHG